MSDEQMSRFLLNSDVSQDQIPALITLSGGCPGIALSLANNADYLLLRKKVFSALNSINASENVLLVSNGFKDDKDNLELILTIIEDTIRTTLLVCLGQCNKEILRYHPKPLQQAVSKAHINGLLRILDAISTSRQYKLSQLNWQAILDILLTQITEEYQTWLQ